MGRQRLVGRLAGWVIERLFSQRHVLPVPRDEFAPLGFPRTPEKWSARGAGWESSHHCELKARLSFIVLLRNLGNPSRKSTWLAASRIFSLVL